VLLAARGAARCVDRRAAVEDGIVPHRSQPLKDAAARLAEAVGPEMSRTRVRLDLQQSRDDLRCCDGGDRRLPQRGRDMVLSARNPLSGDRRFVPQQSPELR
jgi:hypothetical protein